MSRKALKLDLRKLPKKERGEFFMAILKAIKVLEREGKKVLIKKKHSLQAKQIL